MTETERGALLLRDLNAAREDNDRLRAALRDAFAFIDRHHEHFTDKTSDQCLCRPHRARAVLEPGP